MGLKKTNIVGHSMGGWLASLFAYESPERVNKLVLVGSGGAMPRQLKSMVEFQPPTRESLRDFLSSTVNQEGVDMEALTDYHMELTKSEERLGAYRRVLTHMNNMETRSRYNTVRRFPHISVPTMVLWGRNDEVNALEMGEMTQQGIPNAKMVMLECGHFVPTEDPDGFNKALLEFLPD
jgi:pimeloyl-ACP methyl ester carboxylesterase